MSEEIYFELGLGTRMRRVLEMFSAGIEQLYDDKGLNFRASYFYVFYAVKMHGPIAINDIAVFAGVSHSAVSQTVKKLRQLHLISSIPGEDGRQKLLTLSSQGLQLDLELAPIWHAIENMIKEAIAETGHDFMAALTSLEAVFRRKSFYSRLKDHLSAPQVQQEAMIEPYHTCWKQSFYDLNIRWLEDFFVVEPIDEKVLSDPERYILDDGGEIYFAVIEGRAVGTVALKRMGDGVFELTKLGVDPTVQKQGLGRRLCEKVMERFIARGGKTLFLETNMILKPAIKLYHDLGFKALPSPHNSPYARADYYMEWQPASVD